MKFSTIPYADAALMLSLLLAPLPTTAMFSCEKVVSDGQAFNLKALGGPHSIVTSQSNGNHLINTTYTVDICAPLKKKGKAPKGEACPNGARVCAIKHFIKDDIDEVLEAIPLAGDLRHHGGYDLDSKVSRLSKIDPDSGKEGLRVLLSGGFALPENHVKRKQHTVIDFICNKDLDGTEGEHDTEDKYEPSQETVKARAEDEGGEGDGGEDNDGEEGTPAKEIQLGLDKNPSLRFDRYGPSDDNTDTDVDVLHLTWSSKYVCESKADDGKGGDGDKGGDKDGDKDGDGEVKKPSSHWGFFTWIVVLVFFGTAAYLIFGSWLNYTRYGARGWDLLPHGDTIRDIPYLMKDWARRVLNTVQGSGSRGGYSAV
ncbi:autophagy-related protein 27 [Xylaria arbuscula]|nr:autophagy-related protein 27 [Xylaria arbuscula]